MTTGRQMKIGAIISAVGSHPAGWRHPDAWADDATNVARPIALAQAAERAKLDFVFLADSLSMPETNLEAMSRSSAFSIKLEPLTLLTAIACNTSHIGLVATSSTTYGEPYSVARQFASLDHISGGRAGWNLVTSNLESEAANYSRPSHLLHADRYERAEEFVDVVHGLWDSWADDAFVRDKASGRYFEPGAMRVLGHEGPHFQVRGPLNVARPPQGHPVVFQAGSSDAGVALAGRTADCVFTNQPTLERARAFYAKVKAAAASSGRDPDQIKVMPGFYTVVGDSEAEAREKFEQVQDLIHPVLGLQLLGMALGGVDCSGWDVDGPVPDVPETNSVKSRQSNLLAIARSEGLSVRELWKRYAAGHGNWVEIGTPAHIADVMEEVFLKEGADGFALSPAWQPGSMTDFFDKVVPELQRRGLFRTDYEGASLRDRLGLVRPAAPVRAL